MKLKNSILVIRQLDKKLQLIIPLQDVIQPADGWIKLIRTTLNMSLRQLAKRMSLTVSSVNEIEIREREGTLTLKILRDAAQALDMKLVYGFIPNNGSLENIIEHRAYELAATIVERTSTTMRLEDQENSNERIQQAIQELAEEIKREMPKKLWD